MAAPSTGRSEGNPDIVGVLAALTEPNIAADLGLSDEQLTKLRDLVKQHEGKAIDFAAELRAIEDPIQRKERARQNLRSVEIAGMTMLNFIRGPTCCREFELRYLPSCNGNPNLGNRF